ncbi:MAG: hypothetical protein HQM16_11585 [Deltaproteobacteria bacterium]|nr:hypothetical protein [Deltaproteobacteria bacterium]
MIKSLRQSTLETLGLGSVLSIFKNGRLPVDTTEAVCRVFGGASERGSLVISGANGIVGAGKAMQLGSRLASFGVPVVALDFAGSPDGIGQKFAGLKNTFGTEGAARIMQNIIRLNYDGKNLPADLKNFRPRFLLEAVPEILEIKKAHYAIFRAAFPDIEIRSVTSGFPGAELGVGITHPAFPHEINKVWEVVEKTPSAVTQLFWALGMIPVCVSDHWSFVLDVLFCGLTLAGLRYHLNSNMPFWRIDKYIRKLLGPNPFRAHDAIGAKGANFLTWSCLHHLGKAYGGLFTPPEQLKNTVDGGQNWYPLNHFRPLVNWQLDPLEEQEFNTRILGPLYQMASLMLHENRAHYANMNIIGELCAQFRRGVLAEIRARGADAVIGTVTAYHKLEPQVAKSAWYPRVFDRMDTPEWQQLYVNAEHDGTVGVLTIGRESYNTDVDGELNRAIDWLKSERIQKVILCGDFHFSTQMVGADTSAFFPALKDESKGYEVSYQWSKTARRLNDEFKTSVGCVTGKRCLGGMLELMMHCHYLVAVSDCDLGMPEVTLPVIPGMEGCHWPFRRAHKKDWPRLVKLLLGGRFIKAKEATGWLVDDAGSLENTLKKVWRIAVGEDHGLALRPLNADPISGIPTDAACMAVADDPVTLAAQKAILDNIIASCGVTLNEAIDRQARHSAGFMSGDYCRGGAIGQQYAKTMKV